MKFKVWNDAVLKIEGKQAGVKAWLTKPYDDEDLIEVVKRLLE